MFYVADIIFQFEFIKRMRLLASLFLAVQGQYLQWFTSCPKPTNFNLVAENYTGKDNALWVVWIRFKGVWYDVSRIPVDYQDDDATCPKATYTYVSATEITVNNT